MSLFSFFGLTSTAKAELPIFNAAYGMSLIEKGKFDESAKYFEKHLERNATAHYGLALSKFRIAPANLSVAGLKKIIDLFESAISLSPDFSDAYFMCAMAYNQAAGLQLGSYNKKHAKIEVVEFKELDAYLVKAENYFHKAVSLNPSFSGIAESEVGLNQRLKDFSNKLKSEL